MKRLLLSLLAVLSVTLGINAQTFDWGTATWNIEDGSTFDNIDSFNVSGLTLTYPNPSNYRLTRLNVIGVNYNIYVDGSDTPIEEEASAQGSTVVNFDHNFAEGHSYKIVTTGAILAQVNLATFQTDTVSTSSDAYTINFTIKGPEIVDTINVDGTMSLTITDQNADPTYSVLDVSRIKSDLGINDLNEASFYGLNPNGSYNEHFEDYYDGWRDANGDYAYYYGGYDHYQGHNAYPVVYDVKANENRNTLYYYYYDYWKLYDPNDPGYVPATGSAKSSHPNTSYHSIIWDYQDGDSIVKYVRNFRVDEGSDYKASFIFKAHDKAVLVNATLHFVSQEAYAAYKDSIGNEYSGYLTSGIAMRQDPATPLANSSEAQKVTIRRGSADGLVDITFSGYTIPMMNFPTGEFTLKDVTKTTAEDGSVTYSADNQTVAIKRGMMTINYIASLTGTQVKDGFPELTITLSQSVAITSIFRATENEASQALNALYNATGISKVNTDVTGTDTYYDLNGRQLTTPEKGINIVKETNGKVVKVIVK